MSTRIRLRLAAFLLLGSCLWAGIQYAGGTNVNTTFTTTVGTRQEIVTGVQTALTTAGWTVISGGGTGDVLMQSATTPTANNQIQARLYDPGAGSCAQVFIRNIAGTKVSAATYLLPAALKVFRVIANKYQAFVFTPGSSAAREFVAFGVPYIPTFLHGVITAEFGWIVGNAIVDTDTTVRPAFRTILGGQSTAGSESACYGAILNTNLLNNCLVNNVVHVGAVRVQANPYNQLVTVNTNAYRWHDDSLNASEALVAWGLTLFSDESKIRGQLWDAIVISDPFAADTTITLDARSWFAITNSNAGTTVIARGTLFLVIP